MSGTCHGNGVPEEESGVPEKNDPRIPMARQQPTAVTERLIRNGKEFMMYETPTLIEAGTFLDLTRQTYRGRRFDHRRHRWYRRCRCYCD
jgi:hypothetical protein